MSPGPDQLAAYQGQQRRDGSGVRVDWDLDQGSDGDPVPTVAVDDGERVLGIGAAWVCHPGRGRVRGGTDRARPGHRRRRQRRHFHRGGDTHTNGDNGRFASNALGAEVVPVAQFFGNAASWIGASDASATNNTSDTAGGDLTTSGTGGTASGNIGDVPAAAVAQVFGNAAV